MNVVYSIALPFDVQRLRNPKHNVLPICVWVQVSCYQDMLNILGNIWGKFVIY